MDRSILSAGRLALGRCDCLRLWRRRVNAGRPALSAASPEQGTAKEYSDHVVYEAGLLEIGLQHATRTTSPIRSRAASSSALPMCQRQRCAMCSWRCAFSPRSSCAACVGPTLPGARSRQGAGSWHCRMRTRAVPGRSLSHPSDWPLRGARPRDEPVQDAHPRDLPPQDGPRPSAIPSF